MHKFLRPEQSISKDYYPLPQIDLLVDSIFEHELICMLDAYQDYHQILLVLNNKENVSFIILDDTFCYMVIFFDLKNIGIIYQKLMNRVFKEQMGRNIKMHTDDILVKLS